MHEQTYIELVASYLASAAAAAVAAIPSIYLFLNLFQSVNYNDIIPKCTWIPIL